MTIFFIARTVTVGGAAEPTGTQQGDLVFCIAYSGTTSIPSAPAGWTQLGSSLVGGTHYGNVWWIMRGSSAPSYSFTNVGSGRTRTVTIRGASSIDNVGSSANASAVSPSVNATNINEWLTCWFVDDSSTAINAPTGMTAPNLGGTITDFAYVDLTPTSGATGTKTFTGTVTPIGAWSATLFNGTATVNPTITASTTITANKSDTRAVNSVITASTTVTAAASNAGFASATANSLLNVLRNISYTGLSVYVQLHKGAPGPAGTANVSSNTTRNLVTWHTPSGGSMTLNTIGNWLMTTSETISNITLWDASSSGNFLRSVRLTTPVAVINGTELTFDVLTLGFSNIAA